MRKIIKFLKKYWLLLLMVVLVVPAFWQMLKPGIYSTQDFHLFRLVEFDKCVKAGEIPCRWAPDAGLGYGEPLFNFYGQLPYAFGEIFHLAGVSFIDSFKILFVLSLVGSAATMFFLAKKVWGNNLAAVVSSILYVYAPYRAVDVWVRGALPEALAFVIFPLLILMVENKSFFGFTFLLVALILTHNLSVLMFLPVVVVWAIYRRFWKVIPAGILAGFVSAFYILPVVFESKYITLASTIQGYFDFRGHFATLYQLLASRFWGYGASVFGSGDGLSLAVGYLQWILPLLILVFLLIKKAVFKQKSFLLLFILGWFFLFLTHNKSTFLWKIIPGMAYIQFPWRFLSVVIFCFALASGAIGQFFSQKYKFVLVIAIIFCALALNFPFFRPDIWYSVNDSYFSSGAEWDRQRTASIGDFWPNFGHKIPDKPSDGSSINYFPGWNLAPNKDGLIPAVGAVFKDTPIRKVGNIVSLVSLVGTGVYLIIWRRKAF
jgi:hypothetical protein